MTEIKSDNSIIIIGAGFAGLCAGIYAQMNGYKTQIFELHDKPGGLCTSWKRKGYIIDGCIHWFVGSSPESSMHDFWEEVGVTQGREFIYMDEYMHFESPDGRVLTFYTDVDRLEKHLLEFSPADAVKIGEFINAIRVCLAFDTPSKDTPFVVKLIKKLKLGWTFVTKGKKLQEWMKITGKEFAAGFKDPVLKKAFDEMWMPEFSIMFLFFTFAYLHKRNAGYPLGGSMPLSLALEDRYKSLGGTIHYKKRVEKILNEGGKAYGIRTDDGTEYNGSKVISGADGYSTIFRMLEGKFTDDRIRHMYEKWIPFHPLIFIGIGVNRKFDDIRQSVSGFSFPLKEQVKVGDRMIERLPVHLFHHDASMAPDGRTALIIMLETDYEYWKKIYENRDQYDRSKQEIADTVVSLLEQRFPGISSQVEMTNVATPMTFERYTGNWKGSFEGWQLTPENSYVMMKPLSQTLPGLSNFYMCGQWVEPGGGLPTGVMSARRLIRSICKEDHIKFKTSLPNK
jgi:phytoene dehydrogenase-like protein